MELDKDVGPAVHAFIHVQITCLYAVPDAA
jgi:hypothetical protein